MATLTDMPALGSASEGTAGGIDRDEPKKQLLLFTTYEEEQDPALNKEPVFTRTNLSRNSISRDLFQAIQASLENQIQRSKKQDWRAIQLQLLFLYLQAAQHRPTYQGDPGMADIRRLMFEENIPTEYSEVTVPAAAFAALGYTSATSIPNITEHASEIVMFAEGFQNAALSRSQRENPEKLDFKPHTLIGTKLGVADWCTSKLAHRQLNAIRVIRAVGTPQADPDHETKLAEALALFDIVVNAADSDRVDSLVVAWPLAQEVAQFVNDHTEFLVQCCLNNDIEKCIKRTASLDSTKPNVDLLNKNFRDIQVIPIHPAALVEKSALNDIIAESSTVALLSEIEGGSVMPLDDPNAAELAASDAEKLAGKAAKQTRQKEKRARHKEQKRLEKAEAMSLEMAEVARKQQIKKDAEIARQAAIDQKLQMAREALEAAELVKREEEELVRRQQAKKDADMARQAALDQKQKLLKEANDAADVAQGAEEAAQKQEMAKKKNDAILAAQASRKNADIAKQAEEAAETQAVAKKKKDALLAAQAILRDAELAVQKASLEAQQAIHKQRAKEAELAKAKQAIEQAAKDAEATMAQQSEVAHKQQPSERALAKAAQKSTQEDLAKKAEITEETVATDLPKKVQILKRPVPDVALPRFPVQKAATKSSKLADTAGNDGASFPIGPSPKTGSPSEFSALSSNPKAAAKHSEKAATSVLSFSNIKKVAEAPPRFDSKGEFPQLGYASKSPSTFAGNPAIAVAKTTKMAESNRAPPRAASTSHSSKTKASEKTATTGNAGGASVSSKKKADASHKTDTAGNAGGSSVPSKKAETSNKTDTIGDAGGSTVTSKKEAALPRRPDVVAPKPAEATEQLPDTAPGRLDRPWRGALSVNTDVAADTSMKSPPTLGAETSPVDDTKTRAADGQMQRRSSINFIRSRTNSRASLLQSPLAPASQLPLTPVTGHNSPSSSTHEDTTKAAQKQPTPVAVTPTVSGGVKGPLAMAPWEFYSGSAPQVASASGLGHAHPTPVFMSEEEPVSEHKELKTQVEPAAVKHHEGVSQEAQLQVGNIEHKAVETKSAEHKSVEHKPVKQKAVEHKPVKQTPVEHKPVKQKAVEHKPVKQTPVEHKPVKQKAVEHKPVKQTPVEHKPVKQKPVEHKPHASVNDTTSKNRTFVLKAASKRILDSTKGRHNGGEIVTLKYPRTRAQGGGHGNIMFVLPPNRGNRNRSSSVSFPLDESDDEDCDDDYDEDDEGSGPRSRSQSVSKSWKLGAPASDLSGSRRA